MLKSILAAIASFTLAACASYTPGDALHVRIAAGKIAGTTDGSVDRFLGVPYAAAPVGAFRWRAPQPLASWKGMREATEYGHECMQIPYAGGSSPLRATPSEDCLNVNIWRPADVAPNAKLPVLVWIYGGGAVNGGTSPAVYSGDAFARDGVIMVSYNYRLGRFGYFGFPALSEADEDDGLRANYAFMDSIAALEWVQDNIDAFGGNPDEVTIYGQSAGAIHVQMLLGSPLARGLFARAIIQSGGVTSPRPVAAAEEAGVAFARRWGIEGTDATALAKLRALSAEQVTDGLNIRTWSSQRDRFVGSTRDGQLQLGSFVDVVAKGLAAKVPLIIGSTAADNYGAMQAETLDKAFTKNFSDKSEQARSVYLTDSGADPEYVLHEMGRDMGYREPSRFIATKMRACGVPVYRYRFGYVTESMREEWPEGPPHGSDIPYAMDMLHAVYGDAVTVRDEAAARMLHGYWVNFVKSGDPNGPGLPNWPVYERKEDVILNIRSQGEAQAAPDPRADQLDVLGAVRER